MTTDKDIDIQAIDIHKLLYYLPHRYPFLLIDRVEHVEPGKSVTALKNVTFNEPYFSGHFPENPVMPGVLILEAMAQTAGVLAFVTKEYKNPRDVLYFFAGVDNARFKHIVSPGDQLRLHMTVEKHRQDVWKFNGQAMVGEVLVCSADIMLAGRKDQ
jgi:3-hydroxyacyl-[acyl-carrier-protein] dehydratase